MEQWRQFKVGDIVTRIGTDEHKIISIGCGGDIMTFRCIKAPHDGFCRVGDTEQNVPWRYNYIKDKDDKLQKNFF